MKFLKYILFNKDLQTELVVTLQFATAVPLSNHEVLEIFYLNDLHTQLASTE